MDKTYRSIFKWGDKREEKLEKGVIELVKEKFQYTDQNFQKRVLYGDEPVNLAQKPTVSSEIQQQLMAVSGKENVRDDDFSRASHAFGKFYGELLDLRKGEIAHPPDLVITPRNEDEIVKILDICQQENIAVTPVGALSSVTRGVETPRGGISLDMTKHLNKIIKINESNASVQVEPGIFGPVLEKALNGSGYTCGHFPQSFEYSTVGGWVAARGAGQASTGYGKIDDLVLALRIVTPVGIIETKDFPATAEAWDLNKIFIGSEGTLGIITSVTLKIRKYRPENTAYASFVFRDFVSATQSMQAIMQAGIGFPHLFRLSDPVETATAFKIKDFDNSFPDRFLKMKGYASGERCLMFVSVEGDKDYTYLMKKKIKKIARKYGAFYSGRKPVKEWLEQRYESAYLRDPLMDIGVMTDTVETSVSWDNLLNLWSEVRNYLESRKDTHVMAHISHVYENGANLYFTFLSPMKQGDERADYLEYHHGLIDAIHDNGGSLSHHHGIGRALAPWMEEEMGKTAMGLLQAVKDHLDPKGIMNPGNMLGLR
jgi:alkyldihydroxyacetonephosphate synthase